jgi:hypothetical protein
LIFLVLHLRKLHGDDGGVLVLLVSVCEGEGFDLDLLGRLLRFLLVRSLFGFHDSYMVTSNEA